jgi:phytoene dehydrogenase-like protein
MANEHVVIVGGGLAGLAAGCYARSNGFRTTIVEHNIALGGVCTAWSRGPYTIDGCIQWLTGGPFDLLYEELGIFPKVSVHPLQTFLSYRNVQYGARVDLTSDLEALGRALLALGPDDSAEVERIIEGAKAITRLQPPLERPAELTSMREALGSLWQMRSELATLVHFRKPVGEYVAEHLRSPALRRFFASVFPVDAPMLFLLLTIGYLSRGWLSRPDGGTARFRDALIDNYRSLGGEARLHATVDEILVEKDRARGVVLGDGTQLAADYVISTASTPETVLRLLGGAYGADPLRQRLAHWKLFDPIVLVSFGVAADLAGVSPTLVLDGIDPLRVGQCTNRHLLVRIFNDDPTLAPPGHTVVQAMLATDYDYWATRGNDYNTEKEALADAVQQALEQQLPALLGTVRVVDVATPLTFWGMARSWRGAYEGWMPSSAALLEHVDKRLPGLSGFYMAGQWVEPGGGVPLALMSGRHVVQLLCEDTERGFQSRVKAA